MKKDWKKLTPAERKMLGPDGAVATAIRDALDAKQGLTALYALQRAEDVLRQIQRRQWSSDAE